jgi:wobble nucleotide-excising tRNase
MTPVVFDGFAETKRNLEDELAPYKSLIISDVKSGKKTRASLNKLAKQVNDRKKELKRPYVDATKPMEDQAKELIALIDAVVKPIDEQIKAIESEERQQRISRLKALIADMAFSYQIDPYQVDIKPNWANKSIGDLELKRQIKDEFNLMIKYGKGVLPDGINRVNGALVSDDGEMVQKHLLTVYVTDEQLKTLLSDLNVAQVPYEKLEV